MTSSICCKLTIFEGPDGSGKTTAAKAFAQYTGAKYVHFPALPRVSGGLGRMYVEAMLPALLGYQDVVFDRSWRSELPYGMAFRGGKLRLDSASLRMLDRLAMRCGAVMVMCLPPWETVSLNYISRKKDEMLETESQLKKVYDIYSSTGCSLERIIYDYTQCAGSPAAEIFESTSAVRAPQHFVSVASAGNPRAGIALVGESFGERKDQDPWYQWPFASFSGVGCSAWLTDQLTMAGRGEEAFFWINSDQDLSILQGTDKQVIALGNVAYDQLSKWKITADMVPHPAYQKRFSSSERYSLLDLL